MSRMWLAAVVIVAAVPRSAPAQDAQKGRRPNVLLLLADDHAAYALGCYGDARAKTPNLDKLAAGGMRFQQAFCSAPVCTASRQSFITGLYPRTVGVTQLKTALPATADTLGTMMQRAGYKTAAI